ncbi:glycosyltransferase family 2 protein [Candidatus Roizmanbacteria bacterium]|nr:glycosyltransferase family 2 protein [Candidatus Roizmanbacteria bacterium]
MSHRLAIITVVYENYTVLKDFTKSLEKQLNKNFHLYLVDLSEKKQIISSESFSLSYIPSINRGYAYGVNLGLRVALKEGYQDFCVMNSDIYFNETFVDSVVKSFSKHAGSILGGKIYYAPRYEYHKETYEKNQLGKVLWYAGGSVDWKNALTPHRGVDEVDHGQYSRPEETEFITGALMFFDKTVINTIGFWDEGYFLYFEDADFCERAKKAGIKLYFDPSIIIWHKNAQSTGGPGSTIQQKLQGKNRLRFALKYGPLKTKFHVVKNYVFK